MCTIDGTVRVDGDLQNVTVNANGTNGFKGQIHATGSLLGTLGIYYGSVIGPGPDAAIVIDQDLDPDGLVHLDGVLGRGLVVNGAAAGDIEVGAVSADLVVNGPAAGNIELGGVSGEVHLSHGLTGELTAGALTGQILVAGDEGEGLDGELTLTGAIGPAGAIEVSGLGGVSGTLTTAAVLGTIHTQHDVSGEILLQSLGDPNHPSALVQIDGDLTGDGRVGLSGSLYAPLEVRGSVAKTSPGPAITVAGDAHGEIRVYGSLCDDPNAPYEIAVGGTMPSPGAVAIDWDGDDVSDVWEPGAVVRIGRADYSGNDWQARVYEIGPCRGDMQGDWAVGFPDINPFIMALDDVENGTSNYAAAFPGLEGSMAFHGDADCSGEFDSGDINPFVARVESGDCDCDGRDGGDDLMPPEDLAAILAKGVAPELYDALLRTISAAIDAAPDKDMRAYWEAVYAALTQ